VLWLMLALVLAIMALILRWRFDQSQSPIPGIPTDRAMRDCPWCGKRIAADWAFCPFCARALAPQDAAEPGADLSLPASSAGGS